MSQRNCSWCDSPARDRTPTDQTSSPRPNLSNPETPTYQDTLDTKEVHFKSYVTSSTKSYFWQIIIFSMMFHWKKRSKVDAKGRCPFHWVGERLHHCPQTRSHLMSASMISKNDICTLYNITCLGMVIGVVRVVWRQSGSSLLKSCISR